MSFFDDTLNVAKDLLETAAQKTSDTVEVQKIRVAIAKKKSELSKQFETLGRVYYQSRHGEEDTEGLASLSTDIEQAIAQLNGLKAKLEAAKKIRVCAACGKKNPAEAGFCNGCGKAL